MRIVLHRQSQFALACLRIIILSSFLIITACAKPDGSSNPDAPVLTGPSSGTAEELPPYSDQSDASPLWESKSPKGREWTAHVLNTLDHLGKDLLAVVPADAALFCPAYSRLSYAKRKQYWAFMLSSMVRFESNFKPDTSYRENFVDRSGKRVISRGLLQISKASGNAYGCGFRSENDLHDPYQNLSCGIRILNSWVGRDRRIAGKQDNIWRGGARYWSVLREGDKTSYRSIVSWSRNLSLCQR